jgi:ribose 5-phosphate isomerase B
MKDFGMVKLAIAGDHAGYTYKEKIKARFAGCVEWLDLGTHSTESVDYPDYAGALAQALKTGQAEKGILICGSGIGISIAANRHSHIRAALCTNPEMARMARLHNDANVLALGERVIDLDTAFACVEAFLDTEFEGGRHQKRVEKLSQ